MKWETHEPLPRLLHIQSIRDVELFGINERNYGRMVIGRAQWEAHYGIRVSDLERTVLTRQLGVYSPSGRRWLRNTWFFQYQNIGKSVPMCGL